jgi:hypothetical protein
MFLFCGKGGNERSEAPKRKARGKLGGPYACYEDGLAVLLNDEWFFFEKNTGRATTDTEAQTH